MGEQTQEQESALLDLNDITVLLVPQPEDPFQEVGGEATVVDSEGETLSAEPGEWLED